MVIKNWIGERYGRLTIQSEAGRNHRGVVQWMCICDCGKTKLKNSATLKKGKDSSCGCQRFGKYNNHYTGYEEISGRTWKTWIANANARNRLFTVTIEEVWNLFLKQNRKCALSGVDLTLNSGSRVLDGNTSLDRIDSNKDYTIDNIQLVTKRINIMKNVISDQEFIRWCKLVANHNSDKP